MLEKQGDALIGRTLAGKYRVEELVSEGGMGTVYRGTHILMDKTVALKVLNPALAADNIIVSRFSREARAASSISHPHAISVTDFGESEDGIVFLVMEFLHGRTLKEVVKNSGPLPLLRVVEIMRQVCGALEAAHVEGVVHRDLKSDNIMLLDLAQEDWVKVLDFGIAKIQEAGGIDPGLTAPDLIIGTPQYMSPEQCSHSSEIDARSDIYSLGVILFELLVGHVPFTGESPTAVMLKHLQDEPPDLSKERTDLPPEVAQVVARALAKRPEDRFQTVSDLSKSLTSASEKNVTRIAITDDEKRRNERLANRIIIPTGPVAASGTSADDEITIVHPSHGGAAGLVVDTAGRPQAPQTKNSNSWRLAAISLLGLLIIGGVLYIMTRSRQAAIDQRTPPLVADPNGRPVKPTGPPTGQAEQTIGPNTPANISNVNLNSNSNTSNSNANQDTGLPPAVSGNTNNANTPQNSNSSSANNSATSNNNSNKNTNSVDGAPATKPSPPIVDPGPPPPASSPGNKS